MSTIYTRSQWKEIEALPDSIREAWIKLKDEAPNDVHYGIPSFHYARGWYVHWEDGLDGHGLLNWDGETFQ